MKLKVWLSVAFCACAMAFAAACSKGPEDVAIKFLEAARDGDSSAAIDCLPDEMGSLLKMAQSMGEDPFADAAKEGKGMTFKVVSSEINGDNATVKIEGSKDGETETQDITLRKIDGDWKVIPPK